MSEVNVEYCNPFANGNYFMRLEHCGRYLFAGNNILQTGVTLDCACADGYGSVMLSDSSEKIIGVDINPKYIELANLQNEKNNVSFLQLDCAALSEKFADGTITNIVSFETIEHLDFPYEAVECFCMLLHKGGRLILSFPNPAFEKIVDGKNADVFHKHLIDLAEVKSILKRNGMGKIKVYGQPVTNILMADVFKKARRRLNQEEHTPQEIIAKSVQLAYPHRGLWRLSYSFIITAEKAHR